MKSDLPPCVAMFFKAHSELVSALIDDCEASQRDSSQLKFTMDGKLIGDIGEWIAIRHFGMKLEGTNRKGVDGKIGEEDVEIKATLRGDGVAFRYLSPEHRSPRLLVFHIPPDGCNFETIYDGPQDHAVNNLYKRWDSGEVKKSTQCMVRLSELSAKQDELN